MDTDAAQQLIEATGLQSVSRSRTLQFTAAASLALAYVPSYFDGPKPTRGVPMDVNSRAARQILGSPATYEDMKIRSRKKNVNRPPGAKRRAVERVIASHEPQRRHLLKQCDALKKRFRKGV